MTVTSIIKTAKLLGGFYKGEPADPDEVKFVKDFQGVPIQVDRPKGFVLLGVSSTGREWKRQYSVDYGFIPQSLGSDSDGLDVFIGPNESSSTVFWATQRSKSGDFEEYRIFVGFNDKSEVIECFSNHIPGADIGTIMAMTMPMFKSLLGLVDLEPTKLGAADWRSFVDEFMKIADTAEMYEYPEAADLMVPPPARYTPRAILNRMKEMYLMGNLQFAGAQGISNAGIPNLGDLQWATDRG